MKNPSISRRHFLAGTMGQAGLCALAGSSTAVALRSALASETQSETPHPRLLLQLSQAHTIDMSIKHLGGYTPDAVRQWVRMCDDVGADVICWSANYVGKATYPSKVLMQMDQLDPGHYDKFEADDRWFQYVGGERADFEQTVIPLFNRLAKAVRKFDALPIALEEAKKRGIQFLAEFPLFDTYFPGLESDFLEEHPQYYLRARDGRTPLSIPCFAEPAVQDYWIRHVNEMLDYGVDGISLNLTSHACWFGRMGPDELGFNPPIVQAYKERYGVNILNEPFEPTKLHELNGDIYTQFLKKLRDVLGPDRPFISVTNCLGYGGYGGSGGSHLAGLKSGRSLFETPEPSFRFNMQWQKWIEEGIVDHLVAWAPLKGGAKQVHETIKSKLDSKHQVFCPFKTYWKEPSSLW